MYPYETIVERRGNACISHFRLRQPVPEQDLWSSSDAKRAGGSENLMIRLRGNGSHGV